MPEVSNLRVWGEPLRFASGLSALLSMILASASVSAQCVDYLPYEYAPIGATLELPAVNDTYWGCGPYPGRTVKYRNNEEYAANVLADIAETYNTDNTPCWPVQAGSSGYFAVGLSFPAVGGSPMFYAVPRMDPHEHRDTTTTGLIVEGDLSPREAGYFRASSGGGYADNRFWRKYLDCRASPVDGKNMACGGGASSGAPAPVVGNPVALGLGNKFLSETDIDPAGPSRLTFSRYYNSHPVTRDARLGDGWTHSYSASVWHFPHANLAKVFRPNGRAYAYRQAGSQWVADPDVVGTLTPLLDYSGARTGWRYVREDNVVEAFDAEGRLVRIEHLGGYAIDIAYNTDGGIDFVFDSFKRRLRFAYDQRDRIASVTHETNGVAQQYHYEYDANENLARVTYPDETTGDTSDNPYREYLYEDPEFPHALTGIIDEVGNRLATYAYDGKGRAVLSTHARDAGRVEIAYDQPGGTVVDNPKGTVHGYGLEVQHGVVKPAGITRQ